MVDDEVELILRKISIADIESHLERRRKSAILTRRFRSFSSNISFSSKRGLIGDCFGFDL